MHCLLFHCLEKMDSLFHPIYRQIASCKMGVMSKKKREITLLDKLQIDENSLFAHVAEIIENRKPRAEAYANREVTLMYWEIGRYINSVVLEGERAEYGKKILTTLSTQLSWSHFIEMLLTTENRRSTAILR